MSTIKRNIAVVGATAVIAMLGVGGVMSANASNSAPAPSSTADAPDDHRDGETADDGANEANEKADDGANEANEKGSETADDKAESGETNDGPDVGPDANPNEPGHQDAGDK